MSNAEEFFQLFIGLTRAYGIYSISASRADKKQVGKAATIRSEVTVELWEKHLNGEQCLGIIPINDEGMCKFGAIDIDIYEGLQHSSIITKLNDNNIPFIVCRSKSGGAHIYSFFKEWTPASVVQHKLKEIAAGLGYGGCEIFPKQIKLLTERGDVGGWINMPYFGGGTSTRYGFSKDGTSLSVGEFLEYASVCRISEEKFGKISFTTESEFSKGPPCLEHLTVQKFATGSRNNGLFNLGVYLRKAFPDEWETLLETYNHRFITPPLSSTEVQNTIKSLRKKNYQYTCTTSPLCDFCNSTLCKTRKFGVGTSIQFPTIHSLTKYDTQPPIWFLDVEGGGRVELSTDELQNQKRFQKRCMEDLNMMPHKLKEDEWSSIVNDLLETVNIIEAPPDASPVGQLLEHVKIFCTSRAQALEISEITQGKPFYDKDGVFEKNEIRHYFRMIDFVAYLNRNHIRNFSEPKIASTLKGIGAQHHFKNFKGSGVNFWSVAEYKMDTTPLTIPEEFKEDGDTHF